MRRLRFALVILLGVLGLGATAGSLRAQSMSDTPAAPKSYVAYVGDSQTVTAGKSAMLEVRFHVMEGFHVNSHTPKSDLLIPTMLKVGTAAGVMAGTLEYPPGTMYSFSFDPKEKLDVYAGDFTVKVPVMAKAGQYTVDATLRYQACDNASCYPPKVLPVKLLFTAR